MMPLVLASQSPRRRELLAQLGLPFVVDPPHESVEAEQPTSFADRPAILAWVEGCARAKAAAVAAHRRPGEWVLGADTIVVLDCEVLHKPADEAEAVAMLRRLQGRTHTVMTGVALQQAASGRTAGRVVCTEVTFYPADEAELRAYVAAGESLDKAGAYAAQGRGATIIERIDGDYFNVVGLPVATVVRLLREVGFDETAALAGDEAAG